MRREGKLCAAVAAAAAAVAAAAAAVLSCCSKSGIYEAEKIMGLLR